MIYLDASADAPVTPEAWAAYVEGAAAYANPSSAHELGRAAAARLDEARAEVAGAIGADPSELVLTSGGTEAAAAALYGLLGAAREAHVVTTTLEHAAVARNLERLERAGRIRLTRVAAGRDGAVRAAEIEGALRPDTRLVSMVLACNETGALQPVTDVAALCRRRGVPIHTDATQAVGRVEVDCHGLGVDALSFSSHKVGAVAGVGVLYLRGGDHASAFTPLVGGGGQEHGRRAGTENVPGASSLAAALRRRPGAAERRRLAELRDELERLLAEAGDVEVIAGAAPRLPGTSCVRFARCAGDGLMMALDVEGVCISTGSACSSGSVEPSSILLGMGLSAAEARETVRFALAPGTTAAEVERAARATVALVRRARELGARG